MTTPPPTKSLPDTTRPAGVAPQPVDNTAVGEPEGAARKGVPIALRPKSQTDTVPLPDPDDPTPERPGIRIYAPPVYRSHYDGARWSKRLAATPTAAYACACGKTDTARGLRAVVALIDNYNFHRSRCPRHTQQEGRAAA
ncbi:hypothetical protein [Streptomyces brasiliscabiei]|uniref:hypothetical protein n=1 Tax=Streptomyces brasiliscabiei TaxID=2736302 RepID=UPI001C20EAAB|nr:hypothetical protein [Streptomyces brasiliscabiei]